MKTAWLLRLYPRPWRQRYGEEMAAMLEEQPTTLRLIVDLLAGAVDARLNPQWIPRMETAIEEGGRTMMRFFAHCQPEGVTQAEYRRSVAWMLGGTLVLALVYIGLEAATGNNLMVEAFGFSVFPIALVLSSRDTYFKPYSSAARTVLISGTIGLVFAVSLIGAYAARFV